ncbi:MAG: DUF4167 domain-containing protein [Alphaproteobacteria bacterium]|nr:DUF4167 domain-containing protein [Alphaproteobacteria bacterium]MDA8012784.1 DUF4167 domain-containing protein [Alphaproteobacteria bacterium]
MRPMRPNYASRRGGRGQHMRQRGPASARSHVLDSNGPSGRLRGTPPQLQEKYRSLAADAQASGDRVLAESLWQHAEHYCRLVNDNERRRESARTREAGEREGARRETGAVASGVNGIEGAGVEDDGEGLEPAAGDGEAIEGLGGDGDGEGAAPRRSRAGGRVTPRTRPPGAPRRVRSGSGSDAELKRMLGGKPARRKTTAKKDSDSDSED